MVVFLGFALQGCLALQPKRAFKLNGTLSLTSSHVIDDGLFILKPKEKDDAAVLIGYDRFKGKEVWKYRHGNAADDITDFLIVEDTLFVGSESLIVSVDLETGKENWRFANNEFPTDPGYLKMFFRGGVLVIPFDGGNFVAFDSLTGKVKWINRSGRGPVQFRPIYHKGVLHFSVFSMVENMIAVDAETGKTLWSDSFPGRPSKMPVIHDGDLFIATNDELASAKPDLFRYDLESGELIWSTNVPATQTWGKIEILGDTLLTLSVDRKTRTRYLNAINVNNGKPFWTKQGESSKFPSESTDLAVDREAGTVYTILDSRLRKIDVETGQTQWHYTLREGGSRVLFVSGTMLYVSSLRVERSEEAVIPIEKVIGFKWLGR